MAKSSCETIISRARLSAGRAGAVKDFTHQDQADSAPTSAKHRLLQQS
jgi:hypothetical protein